MAACTNGGFVDEFPVVALVACSGDNTPIRFPYHEHSIAS